MIEAYKEGKQRPEGLMFRMAELGFRGALGINYDNSSVEKWCQDRERDSEQSLDWPDWTYGFVVAPNVPKCCRYRM